MSNIKEFLNDELRPYLLFRRFVREMSKLHGQSFVRPSPYLSDFDQMKQIMDVYDENYDSLTVNLVRKILILHQSARPAGSK